MREVTSDYISHNLGRKDIERSKKWISADEITEKLKELEAKIDKAMLTSDTTNNASYNTGLAIAKVLIQKIFKS